MSPCARSRSSLLVGLVLLAATLATATPAAAQFGDLRKRAGQVLERVPSLSSFLEGDPPVTTSLDDAVTEIAWLDGYEPALMLPLAALPQAADGSFRLIPGAFGFAGQSYCLKAGTHGPGGGDGYAYAPLAGSKGPIVRNILRNSVAHPEIPQHDVQVLLWAIIARTKLADMPREMQLTAARLLTPREIADLNGGALGLVPESVMQQALAELPPLARQVFQAEARLRNELTQATYSYDELERIAVLAGAPSPDPDSRPVPEGRWSYHPDGYFVRFFPSGYSRTKTHLVVPGGITVTRDGQSRITAIADDAGVRIEATYDTAATATAGTQTPRTVRLINPDLLDPTVEWTAPVWTVAAESDASDAAKIAEGLGGATNAAARAALQDLAQFRAGLEADERARPDAEDPLVESALDLATRAWQLEFCRLAGACQGGTAQAAAGRGRAGGGGVRAVAAPVFDPSGNVGVPGNRGRQRIGQSSRCTGDDWSGVPDGDGSVQLGPDDPIVQALAAGVQASGIANFGVEHIAVQSPGQPGGLIKFQIRLDANGCPLPSGECVKEAIGQGEVPERSQVGAKTLVVGAIQVSGTTTRVNARFVTVETGVITESAKADATGTDAGAITDAATAAFNLLGIPCDRAKGLLDQHSEATVPTPLASASGRP